MPDRLVSLAAEVLGLPPERIVDDLAMKGTENWDSLRHMELVASLEKEFGIELTFEEIVLMTSVGAIRGVLRTRGVECGR
jgi:acyl carrier protein